MILIVTFIVVVIFALYAMGVFKKENFHALAPYELSPEAKHTTKMQMMLEKMEYPESVLDYRNDPYHKYVHERHPPYVF